jgi:hypothetical protein
MPTKRKDRGPYGGDLAQSTKGAIWPVGLGRESLGAWSVLADFKHVVHYPRPVYGGGTWGETPGCGGTRMARLAVDSAAANAPRSLTVSAEGTRPKLHIACESVLATAAPTEAFLDGLKANSMVLSAFKPPTDKHIAIILSVLWFSGVMAPPTRTLLPSPCVSQAHLATALAAHVRVEIVEKGCRPGLLCQAVVHAKSGTAQRWKVSGLPDFILATRPPAGEEKPLIDEMYLAGRVAVGLSLSKQQGQSVDTQAMVLSACILGVVLETAREAKRRAYLSGSRPVPADLATPLLFLTLPRAWEKMRCDLASVAAPSSRVYSFVWSDLCGVMFKRSPLLTVPGALSHALDLLG